MNKLKAGDIVSVLAIVAYDYSPNQADEDREFGVAVKILGPRYASESVRAKAENVRMVTPKLAIGEIVSSGRFDWIILAIVGDYLWLQRDDKGFKIHITAAIHEVARKDTADQVELELPETGEAQPAPMTVRWATPGELAEILGVEINELAGLASVSDTGEMEIQDTNGIWKRDGGLTPRGSLWTYYAFNPPVAADVEF